MTTVKQFTIIPIEACKYFKPKDLYLLAGLYINAPYKEREEYLVTNTTYEQLSGTTGVSLDYIKDAFIPRLKETNYVKIETIQESYMVKRNIYHLPNPPKNFRIIWAELFSDSLRRIIPSLGKYANLIHSGRALSHGSSFSANTDSG